MIIIIIIIGQVPTQTAIPSASALAAAAVTAKIQAMDAVATNFKVIIIIIIETSISQ